MLKIYVKNKSEQCIFGIAFIPESKGLRIYVAWEYEAAAKNGYFKVYKSRELVQQMTNQSILDTMNKGERVPNDKTTEIFPHLSKN